MTRFARKVGDKYAEHYIWFHSGDFIRADQLVLSQKCTLQLYDYQTMELRMDLNLGSALPQNFYRYRGSDQRGRCLINFDMVVRCSGDLLLRSLLQPEAVAKDFYRCSVLQINQFIVGSNGLYKLITEAGIQNHWSC